MSSSVGVAHGCSLWLVPEGDIGERLADEIRRRNRVPFTPHVTLVGGIRIDERATYGIGTRLRNLARRIRSFDVHLGAAAAGKDFFRSVYLSVTRSPMLLDARAWAEAMFGAGIGVPFEPHLSVVYGEQPPEERRRIAEELGERFAGTFAVRKLELHITEGPVGGWSPMSSCVLP